MQKRSHFSPFICYTFFYELTAVFNTFPAEMKPFHDKKEAKLSWLPNIFKNLLFVRGFYSCKLEVTFSIDLCLEHYYKTISLFII